MFLSKRYNGVYYLWYKDELDKKRKVSTGCILKTDALKFLQNYRHTAQEHKQKVKNKTLSQFTEDFIKFAEGSYSPGTVTIYKSTFERFTTILGNCLLSSITPQHADNYKVERLKQISPVTLNIELRTLKAALSTACSYGLTNTDVLSLAVSGTNLFTGTHGGGVFLSTNNGTSWTAVDSGLTNPYIYSLAVSGANLFAGTADGGVFFSTNNGTSWTEVNTNLPISTIWSLAISGTNLFAGTNGDGVWRRPLSEMVTSVERLTPDLPTRFALSQSYPNPFNPSTKIFYTILKASKVTLKIYDILGREVTTLVNSEKQPGEYTVEWDAGAVPSGVYFYRLVAGKFVEAKKMILMR